MLISQSVYKAFNGVNFIDSVFFFFFLKYSGFAILLVLCVQHSESVFMQITLIIRYYKTMAIISCAIQYFLLLIIGSLIFHEDYVSALYCLFQMRGACMTKNDGNLYKFLYNSSPQLFGTRDCFHRTGGAGRGRVGMVLG